VASIAVILLNYRRPQNIGRIVRLAREALPAAPIYIIDNGEDASFRDRDDIPWDEVWLQTPEANLGAGARLALASQLPYDHYLAIDDDLFLTVRQIRALVEALQREPGRAHGLAAQRLEVRDGEVKFTAMMGQVSGQMSVLNMVYAFSREQAVGAMRLAEALGVRDPQTLTLIDDILLSCGLATPAMCHDFGGVERCPTCDADGVALWKRPGFGPERRAAVGKLVAMNAIPVFQPMRVVSNG
jgi:hypothetical protein